MPEEQAVSKIMGVLIFGQPSRAVSQAEISNALKIAGMDSDLGKHLNARSYFIRASRRLIDALPDAALRDKCHEDELSIRFAFLARKVVDDKGTPVYDAVCDLMLVKDTGVLVCVKCPPGLTREQVVAQAEAQMVQAKATWEPGDVHALILRFLRPICRQVPLRPGVSIIAGQYAAQAEAIERFYKALAMVYYVYPIGYHPRYVQQIQNAIIQDARDRVGKILAEIKTLKAENDLTRRKSLNRLGELQTALKEYRVLAEHCQLSMDDLAQAAGDAGKVLVAAALDPEEYLSQVQSGAAPQLEALTDLFRASVDDAKLQEQFAQLAGAPVKLEKDVDLKINADDALPLFPFEPPAGESP